MEKVNDMSSNENDLRDEIVNIAKVMHEKNYIASMDGNISARLDDGSILITPSGVNKGFLKPEQLIVCDMSGRMIRGSGEPSSEILLHLKVYELREDVTAVVHAHPPFAVGLTIAGVSLNDPVLPEVVLTMGGVPTTKYATPSSPEGPEVIQEFVRDHNAIMLQRHGSVTTGKTLMEAYNYLEKVEHAATIILAAMQAGKATLIPGPEVDKLTEMGRKKGFLHK